ncbi:MAG: Lrp/AsnC family transcriptional regulator [Sphingopyxis sp.]|nr:Lrp/AsnC family transcriptional regulator [Sphingopyxis sp.]
MNRSRYVTRHLDSIDRAIIAALATDGRMTFKELAKQIGLSSPSVTERVHKLEDAGAIRGHSVLIDPKVFGLGTSAFVRMSAMPGQIRKLEQMLQESPEVVEADRITGENCFLAKFIVSDAIELKAVIDRFQLHASADTAIILSSVVARRLPKI